MTWPCIVSYIRTDFSCTTDDTPRRLLWNVVNCLLDYTPTCNRISILILSFHQQLGLPNLFLPSGLSTKTLYTRTIFFSRPTWCIFHPFNPYFFISNAFFFIIVPCILVLSKPFYFTNGCTIYLFSKVKVKVSRNRPRWPKRFRVD